ncbi:hypothetical protein F2Q70_00019295 [Brassica cretica]|uniref:Uncharacterized protein n=1 Tax=Brassica cretica TaxID=69181 RepID=A0A8S9GVL6_BRACR|nr:hypothetical protein F2Q70_00019295 [Brassica cretica]
MEPPQTKGTVTPLASLFSEEEARKAASYVEERIREKREEMNRLQRFVDENDNLISLVKKLPEKLHHNVPFGKIAFFPGRLIHTNECLVFLGENYYTDRTSKQTVDVLRRRDKTLQSQIHSLKAEIDDFQTEASFFANTASEAAEGVLEIREEYEEEEEEEEEDSGTVSQRGVEKEASGVSGGEAGEGEDKDDEFARIMSRLNELEMEEEQEEGEDGDDGSVEERELDVVKGLGDKTDDNGIGYEESVLEKPQYLQKEDQPRGGIPQQNAETWRDLQATSAVSRSKASSSVVGPQKIESPIQKQEPKFDTNTVTYFFSLNAFTGLIVEHTHNLETNTHGKMQPSGSQPSKPVSRFKAQRRSV